MGNFSNKIHQVAVYYLFVNMKKYVYPLVGVG